LRGEAGSAARIRVCLSVIAISARAHALHARNIGAHDPPLPKACGARRSSQPVSRHQGRSCAANFCMRYRPGARQPRDASIGASHIGFRSHRAWPPGTRVSAVTSTREPAAAARRHLAADFVK